MRAVVMRAFGSEDVLQLEEIADPAPGPGEALVRVRAVEVSRTRDIATRTGLHPFSRQVALPHVLGGDFAGVVEAAGDGVPTSLIGRRVAAANSEGCGTCGACLSGKEAQCPQLTMLGIHRPGSYAELTTVAARNLNPIPDDVSFAEAAAMAATGPIALTQLHVGGAAAGTWTLVTGATGALGTVLIVIASRLGARVVALSRRPAAIPDMLTMEARLQSGDAELTEQLSAVSEGAGIEVAVDNVAAGDVFARYFPALAIGGRVVISGAIGGAQLPVLPVPAAPFYLRSLSLLGIRTVDPPDVARFWAMVNDGLRMPSGLIRERPLNEAPAAHADVGAGESVAHTVLSVSP